jgi:threonine dehydrogenase-like Zn-dependent dehydrogenase
MRQLTYVSGSTVEWWDVPEPKLCDDGDALVQPLAVTRCDIDLIIVGGKSGLPGPFALGHETAGRVVDVGDSVRNFAPGDLVIVPFQISCGHCERCLRGHTNACKSVPFRSSYGLKPVCGVEYGGALSDLIRVPFADHMLVRQPKGHALSQTAGLADGATDAFSAIGRCLRQWPGAEVLVIGGEGQSISMFAVQAAQACGARRVVYLDDSPRRLAKAKALGAEVHEAPTGDGAARAVPYCGRRCINRRQHRAGISIRRAERNLPAHVRRFHRNHAGATAAHVRRWHHSADRPRQRTCRNAGLRWPCRCRAFSPRARDHPPGALRGRP